MISSCSLVLTSQAELLPISDDVLNEVSGQSGITLNAKVILGDESSIVLPIHPVRKKPTRLRLKRAI